MLGRQLDTGLPIARQSPRPLCLQQHKAVKVLYVKIVVMDSGTRIERDKFYPGPGLESGPLAFRANALTNRAIKDKYGSTIELIS